MNVIEMVLIAVGLGMDALSVSICKGLSMKEFDKKKTLIIGAYFGIFQAVMPILGYFIGSRFELFIDNVSHWIAFTLLAIIGVNMIREAIKKDCEDMNDSIDLKTMIVLAIATSIDALVIGVSFAMIKVRILLPAIIIGIITLLMSVSGVYIGKRFKEKLNDRTEIIGGIMLILIGIKIVIEHYV